LHKVFQTPAWRELRLDIDPNVEPDFVCSVTRMDKVATASVHAVWSSHTLEHLYPHEVPLALAECYRVLKPGGFVLLTLPDLQKVAELVAADKLDEAAGESSAGPITPLDMLYGYRPELARGNLFMAHHTGFTATTLGHALVAADFAKVRVRRDGFNLWATGEKLARAESAGTRA
jgi:hypothetical protein